MHKFKHIHHLIKKRFIPFLLLSFLIPFFSCQENEPANQTKTNVIPIQTFDSILQKARFGREIIEAFIPYQGPAVRSLDGIFTSYELNLANTFRLPVRLKKVELLDLNKNVLHTLDSIYITQNLLRPGLTDEQDPQMFRGSQFGVLNIQLTQSETPTPSKFYHKIHFDLLIDDEESIDLTVEKAMFDFPEITDLVLAPPFKDGNWFYYTEGHKNTRELTEGKPTFAQRFAIDWAFIDKDGTFAKGDKIKNESFLSYGKEILAVKDGVVVAIQDSIPDNKGESLVRAVKIDRYNSSGNHLVLDIGNGVHVFYAHFVPHSFQVKVGDQVKEGQVLGLLGNSGESTGPHLHMHLETLHKLPLGGEGIPYHFNRFSTIQSYDPSINVDSLFQGNRLVLQDSNQIVSEKFPMGIGVLNFDP